MKMTVILNKKKKTKILIPALGKYSFEFEFPALGEKDSEYSVEIIPNRLYVPRKLAINNDEREISVILDSLMLIDNTATATQFIKSKAVYQKNNLMITQELPLVTIVTPSYNQGRFIEETILSVLNQDYPNIEYIVMDGGSTDQTLEILRKYEERVTWFSEKDKGQTDAINKGLRLAKGEILAYLNSDDTYLPGAVTRAVRYLTSENQDSCVYRGRISYNRRGENNRTVSHRTL